MPKPLSQHDTAHYHTFSFCYEFKGKTRIMNYYQVVYLYGEKVALDLATGDIAEYKTEFGALLTVHHQDHVHA